MAKALSVAIVFLSCIGQAQSAAVGPLVQKFTWLMENVEVKGIVRWIDPKQGEDEADIFGLEPDPNYRHLIAVMPGNNPLPFQPSSFPGTLQCETYPLPPDQINRNDFWGLPKKPANLPFEVIIDPSNGAKRQLNVGDHIRVVGRWVIDHHPEWCDLPEKLTPPEPSKCRYVGPLKIGLAHAELHPIRWNEIQLVDPTAKVTSETLSLAAPLHEEVFLGGGKWAANEIALVAGKIFVNDDGSNYHSIMTANADIKAPALPEGFTGDRSLVGFEEAVFMNGTGLDVSSVRSVIVTDDGISVSARINAPLSVPTIPLTPPPVYIADTNDPAGNRSIFQVRYLVCWLRRLRFVDSNGVPYDVDNPFNPASITLPGGTPGWGTQFFLYAQTRGPNPVRITSVTVEEDQDGVFEMTPVNNLEVPPGYTTDLSGIFRPNRLGTFSGKIVLLSNDPANNRMEIWVTATAA